MNEDSTLFSISPNVYAEYLERMSDEEFWDHAFAKACTTHPSPALTSTVASSEDYLPCILCQLRYERCILPLRALHEIMPTPEQVTVLPDVPTWMLGVVSWRGEIIAVIDLCAYLTKSQVTPFKESSLLIVHHENLLLAFCVPAVGPTLNVETDQITFFQERRYSGSEVPIGICGIWEQEDTTAQRRDVFVLDVATLFSDVVQHLEKKASHG